MKNVIVKTQALKKYYQTGNQTVRALDGVNFEVAEREFVSIVGKSGSGKSTLLHMIGGLDTPSSGTVIVDGLNLETLNSEQLALFRRRKVGFIFQQYNLIPDLNVYDNITFPLELDGTQIDKDFIQELLETLNISDKQEMLPAMLSGGEQQRVAIIRALATKPAIILADEPTGNLDTSTSHDVIGLLKMLSRQYQQTLIVIHMIMILHKWRTELFRLRTEKYQLKEVISMLANNNEAIINKLAKNSVKTNKKQYAILFFTIILSAFMLFCVFTIGMTYLNSSRLQNTRLNGAEYDIVTMNGFTSEQLNTLQQNENIRSVGIESYAGFIQSTEYDKTVEIGLLWCDEVFWDNLMSPARTKLDGHYPQNKNELMVTKDILKTCGNENLSVGDSLILTYENNTGVYTDEFVISGIWDGYGDTSAGFVSKAFYDETGYDLKINGSFA